MQLDLLEEITQSIEELRRPGITKTAEWRISRDRARRLDRIRGAMVGGAISAAFATLVFFFPGNSPRFYTLPWCFSALCVVIALVENAQHVKQFNEEEVQLVFEA